MNKVSKILSSLKEQPITEENTLEKFERLAEHIAEENKKINITSIVDEVGIATKHFADSLSLLRLDEFKKAGITVADIGCGGGFPGLPLKIVRDDIKLLMLDSTEKKIRYVEETSNLLQLKNVCCKSGRAEEMSASGTASREKFDIVTSRAVAKLSVLSEICLPFVKVGGYFVSMKAANAENEIKEAENGFRKLGGKLLRCEKIPFTFDIADKSDFSEKELSNINEFSSSERILIIIKKISPTPALYPRAWAKIIKKPL